MDNKEHAARKTIVIEFNGIPGAGKTTTALEVKKCLRNMKIREVSPQRVIGYRGTYKDIILSKEIRNVYIIFLTAFLLIRPITRQRLKYMNRAFNYWLGIKRFRIPANQKKGFCVLDQGVIQEFVSMAYLGKIRNEEKYFECIRQIMNRLDNVIFVNCIVEIDTSVVRMHSRKPNGSRLHQVRDDSELKEILKMQEHQFEGIRKKAIKRGIAINTSEPAEHNAKKIVEYCTKC